MFSYQKIYKAYLDCRQNKRSTVNALNFEWKQERNLFELKEELQNKTYEPGRSICFVVTDPSPREIFAATFKDRVVHHVLVNELEEAGERAFIHDSYSCREGKGTHKAVERLQKFMRKVTDNYNQKAYYLQLDISGFFMNIDRNILKAILKKLILKQQKPYQWKKNVFWLGQKVISYDPTDNYITKGNKELFDLIPPRKSLFESGPDKGLPIGNYSSQFFANLYLNQLDQFVKRELKRSYYLRYVDDFIILGKNKERLKSLIKKINNFLKSTLNLRLNSSKTKLKGLKQGVDFLGYFVKPHCILVRERVVNTLKKKLRDFNQKKEIDPKQVLATINSYFGHFKHADSLNLRKDICENHLKELKNLLEPEENYSALQLKEC
ncbi:MAG: RNA-directed DNA polymerase [Candidatus Paceibacterota bacterium]